MPSQSNDHDFVAATANRPWTAWAGAADTVHDYWLDEHGPCVKGGPSPPDEIEEELRARLDQETPNEPWADTYKDLAVAFAISGNYSDATRIQSFYQQHLNAPPLTKNPTAILYLRELSNLIQMLARHWEN